MDMVIRCIIIGLLLPINQIVAQVNVSGFVRDRVSGERLIGVNVVERGTVNGMVTDNNGYFTLQLKAPANVQISYVGYETLNVWVGKDTLADIRMIISHLELNEVVITARQQKPPNVVTLSNKELLNIPALGGKPDVLKAAQLLPGIQPLGEASSLLTIRGGNPGENQYLLDNVPLIYVNHIGGFMSVFNPDAINGLDIYKGGFPAIYGGKLSAIVDITQREGNTSGIKGTFGVGITDLTYSIEGPTKLKNTSFMITGRKTLTEVLMALASISDDNASISVYGFHDINAKFSWNPDRRNSLHVNLYQGDDYVYSRSKKNEGEGKSSISHIWGNWMLSARWNHLLTNKFFSTNTLSYTRYRLKDKMKNANSDNNFYSQYMSSVQDVSLRSDWKYLLLKNWNINFGLQASYLEHMPNRTRQSDLSANINDVKIHATESALYTDHKIVFLNCITANLGVRIIYYDTKDFDHFSLEPRLRLIVDVTPDHALNMSYTKMSQNSQLLFTASGILNNEVWAPAGNIVPVAYSSQYTLGWKGSFQDNMFQAEADIYYKSLDNLATYKDGYSSLMGDADWYSKIQTDGKGTAQGFELLLRKDKGKWTGFVSYAWAKATRQYPDINKGEAYFYEYDRPHSFSISINREINEKWTFNMAWVFHTGIPYTPAIGRQILSFNDETGEYLEALIYGDRNSGRMRAYHRLDLGFNCQTLSKRNRKVIWTFSIYNAYNRQNPNFYYYNEGSTADMYWPGYYDGQQHFMSLYQRSFFPIIPSISYKLFFDRTADKTHKETYKKQRKKKGEPFRFRIIDRLLT